MKHTYDPTRSLADNLRISLNATQPADGLFKIIIDTFQERDDSVKQLETLLDDCKTASHRHAQYPHDAIDIEAMTLSNVPSLVGGSFACRNELVAATKERDRLTETPERFKQRYIIHGHVQPCVVLYTDETTTLVRLDEGDMMCETDTIQWSDELTYRCQELLASAGLERGSMAAQRVLPVLAELVRDERVLLNDDH